MTETQHSPDGASGVSGSAGMTGMAAQRVSYVSGRSETPLLGITIGDAFDQTVARFPDRGALVSRHQGLRYTWAQLRDEVDRAARGLLAIGITRGQRVGIWSPNRAEWAITQFATSKIGAILVNINPAYRLHELEYALNQSGCTALVLAPNFRANDYTAMMQTLCPELAHSAPGHLDAHKFPQLRHVIRLGKDRVPGMGTWGEVLERASKVSAETLAARQAELQFDDPINIQYTSGTTGNPKGATLSHHNILNNGYFVTELQRFTEQDRLCIPVPLYQKLGTLSCLDTASSPIWSSFQPIL
jgi:fatty-acyl-CoA synthase